MSTLYIACWSLIEVLQSGSQQREPLKCKWGNYGLQPDSPCHSAGLLPLGQRHGSLRKLTYILDSLVWFRGREAFQATALYPGQYTRGWDNAWLFKKKKKKIKPGLIFALWNDHCFLTLSMPPHFCFLYHSCLPSLMVAVFHKCNFMMKRWRECGCGWLPREAVTSAFLYLRDTLIKYQWDFFILNNLRERCICQEIDIECQIYNIKLSYNNYIKNFILNLYTFKIYGTYFISMCSPRKTQQYVSENWKLILKKPIIFIPMGYFRKLIFSKDYRNFHKNILIWLRCSWITSLYWKLGLK